jgi:hypothetical protein
MHTNSLFRLMKMQGGDKPMTFIQIRRRHLKGYSSALLLESRLGKMSRSSRPENIVQFVN